MEHQIQNFNFELSLKNPFFKRRMLRDQFFIFDQNSVHFLKFQENELKMHHEISLNFPKGSNHPIVNYIYS